MLETIITLKSLVEDFQVSERTASCYQGCLCAWDFPPNMPLIATNCLFSVPLRAWLTDHCLFSCPQAEGPSLIAEGTTVRNKLDSFHYKQNLHLDFWTPRCLEFSQLPMVLRCGNLLDCHLNKEFPWSHVCSSEYSRNGHWMKFSHIIALISVNSGLDCLLQICEIFLTGVHHLATIWHSLAGQTNVFWGEINITVDLFLYWWCLL